MLEDDLMTHVQQLCTHPHRAVGSAGHAAAQTHLEGVLGALGLTPLENTFRLPYRRDGEHFCNLVGALEGADAKLNAAPLVLAAHYDTVPTTPGADDNAASVAVVLEVARRVVERPLNRPLWIALFDAEEPPYFHSSAMGCRAFVEEQALDVPFHAAVVLDLVGHDLPVPGLSKAIGLMGAESHPNWPEVVEASREAAGLLKPLTVPNRLMPDMSDHHAFRLAETPFLFMTCGANPETYHRPSDTPERLNPARLVSTVNLTERLIREADTRAFGLIEKHDTTEFDGRNALKAVGPASVLLGGSPRMAARAVYSLAGQLY
jgi:hypothetical protein